MKTWYKWCLNPSMIHLRSVIRFYQWIYLFYTQLCWCYSLYERGRQGDKELPSPMTRSFREYPYLPCAKLALLMGTICHFVQDYQDETSNGVHILQPIDNLYPTLWFFYSIIPIFPWLGGPSTMPNYSPKYPLAHYVPAHHRYPQITEMSSQGCAKHLP